MLQKTCKNVFHSFKQIPIYHYKQKYFVSSLSRSHFWKLNIKCRYKIPRIASNDKYFQKLNFQGSTITLLFSERIPYMLQYQKIRNISLSRLLQASSLDTTPSSESLSSDFVISDKAVARLKQLQVSEKNPNLKLRVALDSGGCAGYKVTFSLESNSPSADDHIITRDGVSVVVDHVSLEYLRNSVLDFKEEMAQSSFVILNENASSCGCGSSISLNPNPNPKSKPTSK